MPTTDITYIA